MYELIQIPDTNCYYIQSPAKIGLVKLDDSRVCLIDSGSDKDAGRKVRQHLDANGWLADLHTCQNLNTAVPCRTALFPYLARTGFRVTVIARAARTQKIQMIGNADDIQSGLLAGVNFIVDGLRILSVSRISGVHMQVYPHGRSSL